MTQMRAAVASMLLLVTLATSVAAKQAPLPERLDAIAAEAFAKNGPGGAVIVVQDGKTLLRKGYGIADLELGVPVKPEMVFRIGSMTKQFTAIAILQLVKAGKVRLDDPLSSYVPGYPGAENVTVEHLLTHSSGIRSYTDLPNYMNELRDDKTPMQMVDSVRDEKPDFAPGEKWAYNNSGYIFLGMIIEKASGMKYADYMQVKVFDRYGLRNTIVGDENRVVAGRVRGYEVSPDGLIRNSRYLSMTQPYAAGAIESNVDDLAKWNELLLAGKVIDKELLARAWTDYKTTDGKPAGYGYGWQLSEQDGLRFVEHGGGIMGFVSHGILVPEKKLFVAVLHNAIGSETSPEYTATRLALEVLGVRWKSAPVEMSEEAMKAFTGVYDFEGVKRTLRFEDGKLTAQREGGRQATLIPVGSDEFVYDKAFTRLKFKLTSAGAIESVVFTSRGQPTTIGKRVGDVPPPPREITLTEAALETLIGIYELDPGFQLTITREGTKLFLQATGQGRAEAFAESETKFFLKVVDAQVEFTMGEDGHASSLTLFQGGRAMPAKRVR